MFLGGHVLGPGEPHKLDIEGNCRVASLSTIPLENDSVVFEGLGQYSIGR